MDSSANIIADRSGPRPIGERSTCRACDTEVRWLTTTDGGRIAIDPTPLAIGTVGIAHGLAVVLDREVVQLHAELSDVFFDPHTCPAGRVARRR